MPMEQAMFGKLALSALALLLLGAACSAGGPPRREQDIAKACGTRVAGPIRPPAHIHGQTWYVGTCGITVVLVDTGAGLVLIDTGPQEAVPHVLASIRALGFDRSGSAGSFPPTSISTMSGASPRCSGKPAPTLCPGRSSAMRCAAAGPFPDDPQAAELAKSRWSRQGYPHPA